MAEPQKKESTQYTVLTTISLVPLIEEEEDLETISTIETVRMEIWDTLSAFNEYIVQMKSNQTRDAGLILLLDEIVRVALTQKELITVWFKAGMTVINILANQGHVKKIEMTIDGDSINIENADKLTVQRLIDIYEAKHPGKIAALSPSMTVQVTGMVSNVEGSA